MRILGRGLIFGLLTGMAATVFSCNYAMKQVAGPRLKALGSTNWISQAYLGQLDSHGTPAGASATPCVELGFNATFDSIAIFTGGRSLSVHAVKPVSDSSFMALGFDDDSGYFFVEDGGKSLSYQTGSEKVPFRRLEMKFVLKNIHNWKTGTELFLNERLFVDKYYLINPDNEPSSVVLFTGYGELVGLANYKVYTMCLDRGCFPGGTYDAIELSDGQAADRFIWNWQNDTLRFYSIVVQGPGIGQQDRGDEIFKFVKQR